VKSRPQRPPAPLVIVASQIMNPQLTFSTSRLLDAKPETVMAAISDPGILSQWWGPRGFANIFHKFDFKPGGEWKHDMVGPDGAIHPNRSVFESISSERVAIRHLETVHEFLLEILIQPAGGQTRLVWNQTFATAEDYEACKPYVPRCNEENLDRLALELAVMAPGELDLAFRRIFKAPVERIYQAWTDPQTIVKWFTPAPWKTLSADLDPRPGGRFFVMMQSPDGAGFPHPGIYLEVVPNRRLVTTDAFSEGWKPSAKPFATLDLNFEGLAGETKFTAIVRHWTKADLEAHQNMGFHDGWGRAADQLQSLVSRES
jgi:uncharacterized protein YndB with AHSA1/START domain